ncbi:MAG: UTP--glucose-1-phosphate uridylyltransferase [Desulfohalobiaceae bacterium]|nr:UTP--glucose-1-phosphate uridylyltransferase [Desulfohalobiaceae bacterium]
MSGPDSHFQTTPADRMRAFEAKMKEAALPPEVIQLFASYLEHFFSSRNIGFIPEEDIEPVSDKDIQKQENLDKEDLEAGLSALDRAVVIKLNGGLGTSMGMHFAKTLLEVKVGLTFLDVILMQTGHYKGQDPPVTLILMNSFNTHKDTLSFLEKKGRSKNQSLILFKQHLYPKIMQDNLLPANCPEDREKEWNPPGHGDLYAALFTSSILEMLLEQGKRYAFVSNGDNLGAVLDPKILGYFVQKKLPFLMEVASRGEADKKGGHIALGKDGRLLLREVAQCPENDLGYFQDVNRHGFFNTNNIWLDLKALKDFIEENGLPRLPLIVNPKTLDPRDCDSPKVYQLETAIGAAINVFAGSGAILVGRDRFLPVKKTNDLLVLRSDCYEFGSGSQLKLNPEKKSNSIAVDLDERFYKLVDWFEARFPQGPPSLVACDSLTIRGDICFGANVVCRGNVMLENKRDEQVVIEDNRVLNGRLVFEA